MLFGEILADLRKDKGLYQKNIAELLSVSIGTISNYETGTHCPDLESIIKLADFFNVSIDYLLGRVKFEANFAQLNKPFYTTDDKTVTIGDLITDLSSLSDKSKKSFVEYLELLKNNEKINK